MAVSLVTRVGHRPVVLAGNAKGLERRDSALTTATMLTGTRIPSGMRVLYAPSPANFHPVSETIHADEPYLNFHLGAQDVGYHPTEGLLSKAVTGIFSVEDMEEAGAFSIVWHSDRRHYFGVPIDHAVGAAKALLAEGLTPVLCCGEFYGEDFDAVVRSQITTFVRDIGGDLANVVIADEPVAHIKTNYNVAKFGADSILPLSANEAQDRARKIRAWVGVYGEGLADRVVVLYGGSVDAKSLPGLLGSTNPLERLIDGGLIASAFVKDPIALIEAAMPYAID